MVVDKENTDFKSLVQDVLNQEFTLGLLPDKETKGNNAKTIFDLADLKKGYFVQIKPQNKSADRALVVNQVSDSFNLLSGSKTYQKINCILVIDGEISNNDRKFYEERLLSINKLNFKIYDRNDIFKLRNKFYESNNQNKTENLKGAIKGKASTRGILTKKGKRKVPPPPPESGDLKKEKAGTDENLKRGSIGEATVKGDLTAKKTSKQSDFNNLSNYDILGFIRDELNIEYDLDLVIEAVRVINGVGQRIDLSDENKNTYAQLIEKSKFVGVKSDSAFTAGTDEVGIMTTIVADIENKINFLQSAGTRVKTYFAVFINGFTDDNIVYANKWFKNQKKFNVVIFTLHDIIQLAEKQGHLIDSNFQIQDKGDNEEIKEFSKSIKISVPTIAGLISDSDDGEDYLDISKDVSAFARVIAAKSFSPPLAIALLGKWGSGKSFFMRKLKERIQNLSHNNNQNAFCDGIAHVHFNAWSYVDANLWAGIITKMFEGLNEYISNQSISEKEKKDIEKMLAEKLNITHDRLLELRNKEEKINKQLKDLDKKKKNAEEELKVKIKVIKENTLKKIIDNVNDNFKIEDRIQVALNENDSFNKSKEDLGKIISEKYWKNPAELYNKSKSIFTVLKTFFSKSVWKYNVFSFCIILIAVIVIPVALYFFIPSISIFDFTITPKAWFIISATGTFFLRTYKTLKYLHPLIASFWKIKEEYELDKRDAIFIFKQKEKALLLEMENSKMIISITSKEIEKANELKEDISYRLENALNTEVLYNFIKKRSVSDDYRKHLGIVSIIRKDFEILSNLFTKHNLEADEIKESDEFKEKFKQPLERIILYIDDLDRCSNERVVQVLEAVNLLMAYPLFIVVVGVDARWVKKALIKERQLQFNSKDISEEENEMIEPSNYLEKIFQVPFQLKLASDDSIKHMLKTLAESTTDLDLVTEIIDSENPEISSVADTDDDSTVELEPVNTEIKIHPVTVTTEENIESLKFSEKEIELLQDMSEVLGNNPRAIKRFVNIYRIIKAHEDFNYTDETAEAELLVVMFLIALPIGKFRKLAKSFEIYMCNEENEANLIANYLTAKKEIYDFVDLRRELNDGLFIKQNILLQQQKKIFLRHYAFIKRFTFNNL